MATDDKISGMIFPADDKAKVSSNDSQTGFLASKLVAGANVTITENNNGANETLTISALGGVTGFTGSVNTAAPNTTVNASRLLVDVPTTNGDLVLQPKGTGAIVAQLPDGTTTGGNKRGANAVDLSRSRSFSDSVASGTDSVALGTNVRASSDKTVAIGWNSYAGCIRSVAIGSLCQVLPSDNLNNDYYGVAIGHGVRGATGAISFGMSNANPGSKQADLHLLGLNFTATVAASRDIGHGESVGVGYDPILLPADGTYTYRGEVSMRKVSASVPANWTNKDAAAWSVSGCIKRVAGVSSILNPTVTTIIEEFGVFTISMVLVSGAVWLRVTNTLIPNGESLTLGVTASIMITQVNNR